MLTELITLLIIHLNKMSANPIEIIKPSGISVLPFQLVNSSNLMLYQGYNVNEDNFPGNERKKRFLEDLIYFYNFFANYDDNDEEDDSSSEEDVNSSEEKVPKDGFVSDLCRNCSVVVNKIQQIQHIQQNGKPSTMPIAINQPNEKQAESELVKENGNESSTKLNEDEVLPENITPIKTSIAADSSKNVSESNPVATDAIPKADIPGAADIPVKTEVAIKDPLAKVPTENDVPEPDKTPQLAEGSDETPDKNKSKSKDLVTEEAIPEAPIQVKVSDEAEGTATDNEVTPAEAIQNKISDEAEDKVPNGAEDPAKAILAPAEAIQEVSVENKKSDEAEDKVPNETENPAEAKLGALDENTNAAEGDKVPNEDSAEAKLEAPAEDTKSSEAEDKVAAKSDD